MCSSLPSALLFFLFPILILCFAIPWELWAWFGTSREPGVFFGLSELHQTGWHIRWSNDSQNALGDVGQKKGPQPGRYRLPTYTPSSNNRQKKKKNKTRRIPTCHASSTFISHQPKFCVFSLLLVYLLWDGTDLHTYTHTSDWKQGQQRDGRGGEDRHHRLGANLFSLSPLTAPPIATLKFPFVKPD
jgi:hypothetical protein